MRRAKPKPSQMITGAALDVVKAGQGIKKGDWIRIGADYIPKREGIVGRIYVVTSVDCPGDVGHSGHRDSEAEFMFDRGARLALESEIDGWYPGGEVLG